MKRRAAARYGSRLTLVATSVLLAVSMCGLRPAGAALRTSGPVVSRHGTGSARRASVIATRPHGSGEFSCSTPTIFLAEGSPTQLYSSKTTAGVTTFSKIGTTHGWSYNAMGYDTSDNLLYAISTHASSNKYAPGHLLEINDTGTVVDEGAISGDSYLVKHGEVTGAFDTPKDLWVVSPSEQADDIDVSSTKIAKHLKPSKSFAPADWAEDAGYLWGMAQVGSIVQIFRFDTATGDVSTFPAPSGVRTHSSFGGAWTYGNGNLGFNANSTGAIYQISVAKASSSAPSFSLVSTGTGPRAGAQDDAASCSPYSTDLSLSETGKSSAAVGAPVSWTLTVKNNGPGNSSGYVLNDPVPSSVTDVTTTSPGCKISANQVTCTEGTLDKGATASFVVKGDAPAPATTCATNTATVIANEYDPKPANNSATLKTCSTTASPSLVSETPQPATGTSGESFADKVTLSGGYDPTGLLTYDLWSPSETTCSGTPESSGTATVDGNRAYTSPEVPLTTPGTYWWTVSYAGDPNNASVDATACADGVFTVGKASPSLGDETPTPSSGYTGASYTDEVTLSGGSSPTGTITYDLWGPSQSSCTGTPQDFVTTDVSGDGEYTSPTVVIASAGTYWWTATYGGDPENAGSGPTGCSDGVFTVSTPPPGACTINWVGPDSGGSWGTASNWSPDRTPDSTDVVCIGTATTTFTGPVVYDGSNGTSNTSILQLKSYATLDLTTGDLLITDTSTSTAEESFTAGLDFPGGTLGSGATTPASVTVTTDFDWTGGTFEAPTDIATQPVLTVDAAATSTITGAGGP
ncbi:MAG: DUF6923 family protein, partial [Acidimicrobiales bacterium]